MNFINEYMTTFNHLTKLGVSLSILSDEKTVTEDSVRRSVLQVIKQQVEMQNNPYEEATWSDVHNQDGTGDIPQPKTPEAMESSSNQERLADWIMQTDEMQEALNMLRGTSLSKPQADVEMEPLDEEQSEGLSVEEMLNDLIQMESDWR